jgi:hypothetical protein
MTDPFDKGPEMVNHPDHYTRGPTVTCPSCGHSWVLECIAVIRWIRDMRLANAVKYAWRVAFGGKPGTDDREDIKKGAWYLTDWLDNPVPAPTPVAVLTVDSKMSEARREKLQQEFEAWQRSGPA